MLGLFKGKRREPVNMLPPPIPEKLDKDIEELLKPVGAVEYELSAKEFSRLARLEGKRRFKSDHCTAAFHTGAKWYRALTNKRAAEELTTQELTDILSERLKAMK